MVCEKYKGALIEAAVTGDELPPAIRAHLELCANCAMELSQHRSLLGAIDANLSRQMNAPISAGMLQRLETQIAQQPQPKRTLRFAQIFAGAFATLAVAAIVLAFLSHQKVQGVVPKSTSAQPPIQSAAAGEVQTHDVRRPQPAVARGQKHEALVATRSARPSNAGVSNKPEVLIPPDEGIALENYIAKTSTHRQLVAAFITPDRHSPEHLVKHIDIPDINTAGIVIAPISEETRR